MADKPFYETEKDLTDKQQERIKVNEDFESQQPDDAAESIKSAAEIEFNQQLENTLEERAEVIQTTNNDPDIPDRYEDDVYVSEERAFNAMKASALRGMGAATSTKGVESPVRWGIARSDDFAKTVKAGEPDDAEFTSDNDLLPMGHPLRSVEDPPESVGEEPFVEGEPGQEKKDELQPLFEQKL
jgi:hypothetical protein